MPCGFLKTFWEALARESVEVELSRARNVLKKDIIRYIGPAIFLLGAEFTKVYANRDIDSQQQANEKSLSPRAAH
jgi:hypothetical protein